MTVLLHLHLALEKMPGATPVTDTACDSRHMQLSHSMLHFQREGTIVMTVVVSCAGSDAAACGAGGACHVAASA